MTVNLPGRQSWRARGGHGPGRRPRGFGQTG